jgi:hypothetical protein
VRRIAGTITLYKDDPFEFLNNIFGLKVTVSSGKKSYDMVTDRNGVYDIWDLPPAKYTILPEFTSKCRLGLVLSKGDVEFKQISDDQVDTKAFQVNQTELKRGGADYVLK